MKETITISDTFQSPLLSKACRVAVTITITGSLKVLTLPNRPVGPQDLTIANIDWVATAGNNQVRFRDIGIDLRRNRLETSRVSLVHRPRQAGLTLDAQPIARAGLVGTADRHPPPCECWLGALPSSRLLGHQACPLFSCRSRRR